MIEAPVLTIGGDSFYRIQRVTNTLTYGATPTAIGASISNKFNACEGRVWHRLRNDGTTLSFDISQDNITYFNIYSEAVGTYITPTHYAIGGVSVIGTASLFIQPTYWAVNVTATATL